MCLLRHHDYFCYNNGPFYRNPLCNTDKKSSRPGSTFSLGTKGKGRKGASKEKKRLLFEWPRGLQGSTSKMMISNAKKEKEKLISRIFIIFSQRAKVA